MTDAPENNSLGGRARRYAKVGRAVGGLAARVAGERYLGLSLDKSKHAEDLKQALGGLKGPLMKVAQIMSTVPDMLPEEYVTELAELQSNAPAMGWLFVRRRMTTELGAGWQDRFASFEKEAAAAASLGQVHRAVVEACRLQVAVPRHAVRGGSRPETAQDRILSTAAMTRPSISAISTRFPTACAKNWITSWNADTSISTG